MTNDEKNPEQTKKLAKTIRLPPNSRKEKSQSMTRKRSVQSPAGSESLLSSFNTGESVKRWPSDGVQGATNPQIPAASAVPPSNETRRDDGAQPPANVGEAPNSTQMTILAVSAQDQPRVDGGVQPTAVAETVAAISLENSPLGDLTKASTPKDGTQTRSRSVEVAEKKVDPQSFAEYIELFYVGKIKSLPETLVQRFTGLSTAMAPEVRSALQQKAIGLDASLEKTRHLMQLASSALSNLSLESMLWEFAQDVVALHPALSNHGLGRSYLFPLSGLGQSLQEVWSALNKCNSKEKPSKNKAVKPELSLPSKAVESSSKDAAIASVPIVSGPKSYSDGGSADAIVSVETKNNPERDFAKARRNAFLCAVLWRRAQESTSFRDIHQVIRDTILRLKSKPGNMENELLESLLSLSASEAEKVGLYAEWAGQTINAQINRGRLLEEQLANNVEKVESLGSQNAEQAALLAQKEVEIGIFRRQLQELQSEMAVQKVHARADYEQLRARSLGVLKKEVMDLENVAIALSRPIPKVETAQDVVTVVVDSLQAYINDLEGKR